MVKNKDRENMLKQTLSIYMKNFRLERGFTQKEFSKQLNISDRSYINLEAGKFLPATLTFFRWMALMSDKEQKYYIKMILNDMEENKEENKIK